MIKDPRTGHWHEEPCSNSYSTWDAWLQKMLKSNDVKLAYQAKNLFSRLFHSRLKMGKAT